MVLFEIRCFYCADVPLPMPSIPPANIATMDLTTDDKMSAADVAGVDETDETSDDSWLESPPEKSTTVYQRTPKESRSSYSAAPAGTFTKKNYRYYKTCIFTKWLLCLE